MSTIRRAVDPDDLLQRLVNLATAEVRRLEGKHRAKSPRCPACGGGGELSKDERSFLTNMTRELRQVAFGARKLVNERLLRRLSEGQVQRLADELEREEGPWLPE